MHPLAHSVDVFMGDLRVAARALWSNRSYSVTAILVLAVSLGAWTAIFAVVDAVVLRPLPFPQSPRLVAVGERKTVPDRGELQDAVAPQNFLDWRERQDVFTHFAAFSDVSVTLARDDAHDPEDVRAGSVTADFFGALGAHPLAGRVFGRAAEADGAAHVAVISYGLWQRRFGGATNIIGRTLHTRLADFEIVAVMPRDFQYPVDATEPTEVWIPYIVPPQERVRANTYGYYLQVVGRLRNGVSIEQARSRMETINAELAATWPRWFEQRHIIVEPLNVWVSASVRQWMLLLLIAVAGVVLIACVNVANLIVLRTVSRGQDLAVRAALGASRAAVCRTLVIETLILALVGATLGLALAPAAVGVLRSALAEVPRAAGIAINGRVFVATGAMAVLAGGVLGLAPAFQWVRGATRTALMRRAPGVPPGVSRIRSVLVAGEIALAAVLLLGATLFAISFWRVATVPLGLDRERLISVRIRPALTPQDTREVIERNRARITAIAERIRSWPDVETTALISAGLPLRGDLQTVDIRIPGRELPPDTDIAINQVSPEYFAALRVPLVQGRSFSSHDDANAPPAVIINAAAARRFFAGESVIGRQVQIAGARTVVGIVADMRQEGPESDVRPQAFIPYAQSRAAGATLLVRSRTGTTSSAEIRRAIWEEFPDLALSDLFTLEHYFDALVAQRRVNMLLLSVFGLFGLLIAALGIHGVMANLVSSRRYDIAVRMAVGAAPQVMFRSVLTTALRHVAIGGAIGLFVSWNGARFVQAFLFHVEADDAAIYAGVLVVLFTAAALAATVPAFRAARIDPAAALRLD